MKQTPFCLLAALLSFPMLCSAQSPDPLVEFGESVKRYTEEHSDASKRVASSFSTFELQDMSWISEDDMYRIVNDSRPTIDSPTSVYMGDTMVIQRSGFVADCVIPAKTVSKNRTGWLFTIKAGIPACKTGKGEKSYTTPYTNGVYGNGNEDLMPLYTEKNKDGTYDVCLKRMGFNAVCLENATEADVKVGPAFVTSPSSLQRSVEYSGKSGSIIKFVYSEYSDGQARDAFTREFEVDLNEGNVAAYKGLVFEILEANNAEITYLIKRHFPM